MLFILLLLFVSTSVRLRYALPRLARLVVWAVYSWAWRFVLVLFTCLTLYWDYYLLLLFASIYPDTFSFILCEYCLAADKPTYVKVLQVIVFPLILAFTFPIKRGAYSKEHIRILSWCANVLAFLCAYSFMVLSFMDFIGLPYLHANTSSCTSYLSMFLEIVVWVVALTMTIHLVWQAVQLLRGNYDPCWLETSSIMFYRLKFDAYVRKWCHKLE